MGPQQSQDSDQSSLLDKGTVQYKGFYSMYFLVQKEDSGFQLILNLSGLNWFMNVKKLSNVIHGMQSLDIGGS